ncbi:uncharacterized protein C05D11.13-like isoform X2 [Dermacentor albipictus]|uniref:uncharacterized protein C05D11.13-like isoform X2 n=1 Tax=Dermacentor albipictus TaxID=60249 RepID=UPI0038FCFBC0
MAGKERAARQTAKRKLQRATETAEEREVRLAKRRAQYAAKQQRSSTESEVKDEVASVSGSTSTRSERRNATKRRIRAEETPEQRQQRLEKERAYRKRQSEKRKEQLAEEMVLLQTQECLTDADIEQREAERCEEHARSVREFESATRELELFLRLAEANIAKQQQFTRLNSGSTTKIKNKRSQPGRCSRRGNVPVESAKAVQTEATGCFPGRVDVAVGTSRVVDRDVCKSTQTSLAAEKVHVWTQTVDLDAQDSGPHVRKISEPSSPLKFEESL